MKKIKKAIFPVAGMGTRILPATKAMPKELLPIIDKPLIQYAVEEAKQAGIEQIIFVTGHGKTALENHFDWNPHLQQTLRERGKLDALKTVEEAELRDGDIAYVRQAEALGLGHAVWCARHLINNEPFAVLLPDDFFMAQKPILQQMIEAYNIYQGNILAVSEVPREDVSKYGIVDISSDDGSIVKVNNLVEKPKPVDAPSNLSVTGRYILQPEIFKYLDEKRTGAGGEIQLTDAMQKMLKDQTFHGIRYEGTRFDCGDRLGYTKAIIAAAIVRNDIGSEVKAYINDMLK
jgi:UTP--glucose-1-phosphate uridylyltransferase